MALQQTLQTPQIQLDPVAKIAFERPALALCYPSLKHASPAAELTARSEKDAGRKGLNHPTVTLLLSSLIELERRDMIAIGTSTFRANRGEAGGIWVTKKVPNCPGSGMSSDLFHCITHGYSSLEDVLARYFRDCFRQDPWTLASTLGMQEAKAYGYLTTQQWPVTGIKGFLSRIGLSSDIQTLWVRDGLKVREATQASRLLRIHIDEFRTRARDLYEGMRVGIAESINKMDEHLTPRVIRLPKLKKRFAAS